MLKAKSETIIKIKNKLKKFFGIIQDEYNCSTQRECERFISKNLRYYRRGKEGFRPVKKLAEILKRCNLTFLGSGASRFVVGSGKFAIKLEKWNEDYDWRDVDEPGVDPTANESELLAYKTIQQDPIRKLLVVPLTAYFKINGSLVLVYPQLDSYEELFSNPEKSHLLANEYNGIRETVCNWLFEDGCANNYGLYKNVLFFLDYNIENDDPPYYGDERFQKDLEKAINDFKIRSEDIHRTKKYIQEMRAIA